jgi:uncharacterized protein
MKSRDRVAVAALRTTLAAIDNAEAVDASSVAQPKTGSEHVAGASAGAGSSDVPRRVLSEAEVNAIIHQQQEERWTAALEYEKLGQREHADRLRREAAVLTAYVSPRV